MILSRRVSLDGIQMDEIDEAVVIRRVDTGVSHESVNAVNRMGGFGQRMTSQHWETLEVSVAYAIDVNKRELERRREIFDAVAAWANRKGWLQTTAQPGKRMRVDKTVMPTAGDLWDWTDEFTILFRAYGVPFWQAETPSVLEIPGVQIGSAAFEVGGSIPTVADVTAKNISGQTIDRISITVGGNVFTFDKLGLAGNETLSINHGTDGLLQIRAGTRNAFSLRTPESADDLVCGPGLTRVSVNSQRAVQIRVTATGRYVS